MKYLSFMILSFYSLWGYSWPKETTLESSHLDQTSTSPITIKRILGDDFVYGPNATAHECVEYTVSDGFLGIPPQARFQIKPGISSIGTGLKLIGDIWNIADGATNCPGEPRCNIASNGAFTLGPTGRCVIEFSLRPNLNLTKDRFFNFRRGDNVAAIDGAMGGGPRVVVWAAIGQIQGVGVETSPYRFSSSTYTLQWIDAQP